MAKLITNSSQVREANDTKYDVVPVPEWGDEDTCLRLRSMTAGELVKFTNLKGENMKQGIVRGLVMSAVDEEGERIFTNDDIPWLMEKNVSVLHRIQDRILILNGLRKEQVDEDGLTELERAGKD